MTEQQAKQSLRADNVPCHAKGPHTLLPLVHHPTEVHQRPFSSLEALLEEPLPQLPEDLWPLAQRLVVAVAQSADPRVLVLLPRAHEAEAFVTHPGHGLSACGIPGAPAGWPGPRPSDALPAR